MSETIETLRAAFHAGATIQAWHLNEGATTSADGRWDDLSCDYSPTFNCPAHLYRIKPGYELGPEELALEYAK